MLFNTLRELISAGLGLCIGILIGMFIEFFIFWKVGKGVKEK